MRLFIDECLSPRLARILNQSGKHVAQHPLDFGGRGVPDHRVLERCIAQELVIVTANARDFRTLIQTEDIHPGLIVLPCVGRQRSVALLHAAIEYLEDMGNPMDAMVNHVLEFDNAGAFRHYPLSRRHP
ncbi:MAG: DUF5615 family PIN-like protein [Deltaproteobacteria bacterium]|nr:DUF5615 family PIN-like protein [Deltaproteobacteria bacterium]